jgi:dihydroflavonol-4-reductase
MDEVFLTGASGFVGSHVLRALLAAGYSVRALARAGSRALPTHPACRVVHGDLTAPGTLVRSLEGCRYLVHVAALYSFAPNQAQALAEINVRGTKGILQAAYTAGVERAVVTSSSATVGPSHDDRPATEEDWAADEQGSPYHASKLKQERVALAAPLPVVVVLPTAPVGSGDWKPTPTGKMIVDFINGRIFGSLGGGMNVVAVEDVAGAHVAALQRGRAQQRYLVGGDNLTLVQLWEALARISGRKAPRFRVPYGVALAFSVADELRFRLFSRGTGSLEAPLAPLEGVRMGRHTMFVRCDRAMQELGYRPSSVQEALERAVRWYDDNGYASVAL